MNGFVAKVGFSLIAFSLVVWTLCMCAMFATGKGGPLESVVIVAFTVGLATFFFGAACIFVAALIEIWKGNKG